jgi:hypothetical protein
VLFAIGLSIYLWDIHFGVAIPVVIITTVSAGFYVVSTILPLWDDFCPYGTTLSKIYKALFRTNSQATGENPEQDAVTSQSLHWVITQCEDSRSVNVALQAIAGANENLPRSLLEQCQADMLICQRLPAVTAQPKSSGAELELYLRALSLLKNIKSKDWADEDEQLEDSHNLEAKIWINHLYYKRQK